MVCRHNQQHPFFNVFLGSIRKYVKIGTKYQAKEHF